MSRRSLFKVIDPFLLVLAGDGMMGGENLPGKEPGNEESSGGGQRMGGEKMMP